MSYKLFVVLSAALLITSCCIPAMNDPVESDWNDRIIAGLGSDRAPSPAQRRAVSRFCAELRQGNILDRFIFINVMLPGDLDRLCYPLVNSGSSPGFSPWINHGFTDGDLNHSGLQGDAVSKYIDTGTSPFMNTRYDDCGLTIVRSEVSLYHQFCETEVGCLYQDTDYMLAFRILGQAELVDVGLHGVWGPIGQTPTGNSAVYGIHDGVRAFVSMSRVASNDFRLYWAYSGQPFALLDVNTNIPPVDFLPDISLYAMATHWFDFVQSMTDGPRFFNGSRCSFIAFHHGLTQEETVFLYHSVQRLRKSLGGGDV